MTLLAHATARCRHGAHGLRARSLAALARKRDRSHAAAALFRRPATAVLCVPRLAARELATSTSAPSTASCRSSARGRRAASRAASTPACSRARVALWCSQRAAATLARTSMNIVNATQTRVRWTAFTSIGVNGMCVRSHAPIAMLAVPTALPTAPKAESVSRFRFSRSMAAKRAQHQPQHVTATHTAVPRMPHGASGLLGLARRLAGP